MPVGIPCKQQSWTSVDGETNTIALNWSFVQSWSIRLVSVHVHESKKTGRSRGINTKGVHATQHTVRIVCSNDGAYWYSDSIVQAGRIIEIRHPITRVRLSRGQRSQQGERKNDSQRYGNTSFHFFTAS